MKKCQQLATTGDKQKNDNAKGSNDCRIGFSQ